MGAPPPVSRPSPMSFSLSPFPRAAEPVPSRAGRSTLLRLALLGVVAVAAVAVGFVLLPAKAAGRLVQVTGWWTMAATFGWFVIVLLRTAPGLWRALPPLAPRERWQLGGVIAGCTLVAALTVPYGYKVLYDEPVLGGTAWTLHHYREVGTVIHGYNVEGVFTPVAADGTDGTYLDKRPFFFAWLVSLLHDLTGYRSANALALNTALMPVVLALLYLFARRLAGHAAALAATFALGSFSLLAHNATGAGMELLNLTMLLLTLHLAAHWLAAPDATRLSALVLAAVLLAQTRYESALYVAPAALAVAEGWRRAGRFILPAAALLGPALLLPVAWQNKYVAGTPQLWELRPEDSGRFGLQYLADNLAHAANYFFSTTWTLTSSWWLFGAGFAALALLLPSSARALPHWRAAQPAALALAVFGVAIAGNLLLLQFYYWGQLDDPIASRLCLPFAALLALCLAVAAHRWAAPRRPLAAIVAGGAALAAFTTGLVANARQDERNILARELAWEDRVVAARPPGERLIITARSALPWLSQQIASIDIERATRRTAEVKFHLEHHTFREVLVIQLWLPTDADGGFVLDRRHRLPDAYVLEPVAERRFGAYLARISRVAAINLPPEKTAAAPAAVAALALHP
jgi:4-amino-4-deoxy-L-arabinose transferase-like glycosyltransferase